MTTQDYVVITVIVIVIVLLWLIRPRNGGNTSGFWLGDIDLGDLGGDDYDF